MADSVRVAVHWLGGVWFVDSPWAADIACGTVHESMPDGKELAGWGVKGAGTAPWRTPGSLNQGRI